VDNKPAVFEPGVHGHGVAEDRQGEPQHGLVGLGWDWIEPQEGKYDFTLVDGLLDGARRHNLRLILLWFGSWKNGLSSFTPEWVKADQQRFPARPLKSGKPVGSALDAG